MKVLKLKDAHKLLKTANFVLVNKHIIVCPVVDDLQEEQENEFMQLEWEDENGYVTMSFNEGDNQQVAISGVTMFLYHSESQNEYDNVRINILQQLENR